MPKHLRVRALTEEEQRAVTRLAQSRTVAARVVQRAKVIMLMLDDATLAACVASRLAGYQREAAGWRIVKRFNRMGVASFDDAPRAATPTHPSGTGAQCADELGGAETCVVRVALCAVDARTLTNRLLPTPWRPFI